jgi:hypothetical protein
VEDKQSEFLFRMCERVADSLQGLPDAMAEIERVQSLRQGLIIHRPSLAGAVEATSTGLAVPVARGSTRFSSCEICRRIDRDVYDFLRKFQSDLVVHPALRACFADHGGLCASHTWLYQSMASSRGTCIGFPEVLDRLAARLRDIAAEPGSDPFADEIGRVIADPENCEVCQVRMKTERAVVADLARRLGSKIETFSAVCLPHLRLLAESVENRETVVQLLIAQAEALDRVSEDMRRYVLRIDGTRRFLITQEEEGAGLRGLMLLAGHRNVGSTWTSAIDNSDGGSHSKRYR